jgi:hypothetical protein
VMVQARSPRVRATGSPVPGGEGALGRRACTASVKWGGGQWRCCWL